MKPKNWLIAFLLFTSSLFSQDEFIFNYDYAVFYSEGNKVILEFYYSFYQPSLTSNSEDSKNSISGILEVTILKSGTTEVVDNKKGSFTTVYDSSNSSKTLTGVMKFQLAPGIYTFNIMAKDGNDLERFVASDFELTIPEKNKNKLQISDLQLATSIVPNSTDTSSMFYKSTLEIVPNPGAVISSSLPVVFFYSEIYNVQKEIGSERLFVTQRITDSYGTEVFKKEKFVPRSFSSIVLTDAVNISDLASGAYILYISVTDTINGNTALQSKRFYYINKEKLVASSNPAVRDDPNYISSEFLSMSDDEIELLYEQTKYILSEAEKQAWAKLTNYDAKRKLLFNIWNQRDSNPGTEINETKLEYLQRIKYANDNYAHIGQQEGWRTDRGRVYIVYGKPTEIERYPNVTDAKPYEIWRYDEIEGGVVFVFADLSGYSDYRLIHSSKRGELSDTNWQRFIFQ